MKLTKSKGIVLILVIGLIFFLALGSVAMFFMLRFKTGRSQRWLDATKAFYLCEAGISMAFFDMKEGILPASGERKFTYEIAGEDMHDVYYRVTKVGSSYGIIGVVQSPLGLKTRESETFFAGTAGEVDLDNIYKLTTTGRRAFPYFILGWPGGG